MTERPDTDSPLVVKIIVEIITYAIYLSWLSVIAAAALYLGFPPLRAIQDAVAVSWQGTAAAIAAGAISLAVLRIFYDALRARLPKRTEPAAEPAAEPAPQPAPAPQPSPGAQKRTKKRKKKSRRSKKR